VQNDPTQKPPLGVLTIVSLALTLFLGCLCAPAAFGVAIWVTEEIDNDQGAWTMVIAGGIVILAQLVVWGLAVAGMFMKTRLRWLGFASIAVGVIHVALLSVLMIAAYADVAGW